MVSRSVCVSAAVSFFVQYEKKLFAFPFVTYHVYLYDMAQCAQCLGDVEHRRQFYDGVGGFFEQQVLQAAYVWGAVFDGNGLASGVVAPCRVDEDGISVVELAQRLLSVSVYNLCVVESE